MSDNSRSIQYDIILLIVLVLVVILTYNLLSPLPQCNLIPGFCPSGYPYRTIFAYILLAGGVIIVLIRTTRRNIPLRFTGKKPNNNTAQS